MTRVSWILWKPRSRRAAHHLIWANCRKSPSRYPPGCPAKPREAAAAQNLLAQGQTLATAIGAFLTGAVSATAGGLASVIRAAHGEVLNKNSTAILYAQVIAGGHDQVPAPDPHHDAWSNLTGLTAEYALRLPYGDVPAFGVEAAFAVAHGSIRKGLTDIARKTVNLRAE